MSGGGGRNSYIGPISRSVQQKIDDAQERERQQFVQSINDLLGDLLTSFNGRDRDATREKLDSIQNLLGDEVEVENILLGGSLAKHTEVDGLSDVDSLVILDRQDLQGKSPKEVLQIFYDKLRDDLPSSEVNVIHKGNLAVTITYKDKTEIQLLPALKAKNVVSISSPDGKYWNETKPKTFQKALTSANEKTGNALVPAIKLMKSINDNLPKQKQLIGVHIEAIAIDAAKNYNGEKTPRAFLLHILDHASQRVLVPMKDKTGQARVVDSYLGKADSIDRKNVSQALSGLKRRLETATTLQQWQSVLGV
jgi:hypothetical protein